MKRRLLTIFAIALFSPATYATDCEGLIHLSLDHATINQALIVPAGTFAADEVDPIRDLPAFCRVAATLKPSPDSDIRIEVWMPISGWNGKYEGTGNGGYAGILQYRQLAIGLQRGYATANTDMGTSLAPGESSLVDHPESWRDWGSRSTHEMTLAAKQIIRTFYGRAPEYSYFVGCSTGGQQGLVEAQRFPDDFDGIIAGAPANNRTHLHMSFIWDFASVNSSPESNIPDSKLPLITSAVLASCSAQKTLASDQFLESTGTSFTF